MRRFFDWLNDLRGRAYDFLSGGKVVSALAHLVLVTAGCLGPAYLAYGLFGEAFAIITFHFAAEVWVIFMTAREVVDYFKHKSRATTVKYMDHTWQDGLGDLAGPYIVLIASWFGVLWLIFGGS